MVIILESSCSTTCSQIKDIYDNYKYNNKDLDEMIGKIKENNDYICSKCNNEKVVSVSLLLSYPRTYIKEEKSQMHEHIIGNKLKTGEYSRPPIIIYSLEKYDILIAAKPDLLKKDDKNRVTVVEITTYFIEKAVKEPYNFLAFLLMKKEQVLIYSYILKKVLGYEIYYRIETYFYPRNYDLEKELNRIANQYGKILKDELKYGVYKYVNNGELVEIPELILKGRFTPGKELYTENIINKLIEKKILKRL